MVMLLALLLFVGCLTGFFGLIRFCEWVLSRREITS